MLTQRKLTSTNNWQSNSGLSSTLTLTNVHSISGKRQYLQEMKGFDDLYTPKNLCLYLVKAAIIPMNHVVNEFNTHAIEAQNKSDDDYVEDFDWNESINRNAQVFWPNLLRVVTVSVLRKYYEFLALQHLSARMTDKLIKDVAKSTARKLNRFPRFVACQKALYTAFYGNLVFNLSCFTYDVGLHLFHELSEQLSAVRASKPALERIWTNIVFILKKGIYYSVCLGSCAAGHAVGTYFNTTHGGTIGAFTFELLGSVACTMLLDDPVPSAPAPNTTGDSLEFPGSANYARK